MQTVVKLKLTRRERSGGKEARPAEPAQVCSLMVVSVSDKSDEKADEVIPSIEIRTDERPRRQSMSPTTRFPQLTLRGVSATGANGAEGAGSPALLGSQPITVGWVQRRTKLRTQ